MTYTRPDDKLRTGREKHTSIHAGCIDETVTRREVKLDTTTSTHTKHITIPMTGEEGVLPLLPKL